MSLPSSLSSIVQSQSPALNVFLSHLSDSSRRLLSKQRPWPELITAFSRPTSFSEAASRLLQNAAYFRINYAVLLGCVLGFSLVSHPASLLCLALLCFAWATLYAFRPPERGLMVWGRAFSRNEVLGLLLGATAFVLVFTSIGSLLAHAVFVGAAVVCIHGALKCPPEDFFSDERNGAAYSSAAFFSAANGVKRPPTTVVSCV